jgi:hypothetical protein
MNVQPSVGWKPPGPTTAEPFTPAGTSEGGQIIVEGHQSRLRGTCK